MKIGKWAWVLLGAAPLLAGCKGFWDAPGSTSFTLSNSGNMTVVPGASGTSTITVTPANSFTGTVALTCSITSSPTGATSPATCSLSPTSVTISSTAAQTSLLTATTTASTTTGAYQITVTGTSGSASQTTSLCAEVSSSSSSCTASGGSGGGVFYVLNQGTKQIVAYSITSGAITQIGSPFTLSAAPYSIAIAPDGSFLYVGTATGIFLFDIGSNGALTLGNSSNVISQDIATTMQVDSTGSWLVEAGPNLAELLAIHVNSSSGVPTSTIEQNTLLPAASVQQLAISPDNAHVFVALGSAGTEDVTFAAGNATPFGSIANLPVLNSAGAALSVAVDPSSRLALHWRNRRDFRFEHRGSAGYQLQHASRRSPARPLPPADSHRSRSLPRSTEQTQATMFTLPTAPSAAAPPATSRVFPSQLREAVLRLLRSAP